MTGAYLRIQRNGKWLNVEVEYLTDAERKAQFSERSPEELVRWLDVACHALAEAVELNVADEEAG